MNPLQVAPHTLARSLGDWQGDGPLHRALASGLRVLILDGRVPLAARLPSERALAQALGLSRTTVAGAYDTLRADGYAVSRRGSGTVAALPGPSLSLPSVPGTEGLIDLSRASPPAASAVPEAVRGAAEDLPRFLHDSGYDGTGLPHLRAVIAAHYTDRGLSTAPAEVLVTLGAQHAIHLLTHVLLSPGDRALIESPTYPHALDALRSARARVVPVPVSAEDGWDMDVALEALRRSRAALAYLMPDFHNPTGASMPADARERLIAAAEQSGTVLLADETTALLDLGTAPEQNPTVPEAAGPQSAQAPASSPTGVLPPPLGAGVRGGARTVVHIGSAGKLFWGGLRVGWIRAERGLIDRLVSARSAFDLGTPVVEQLATARLLEALAQVRAERGELLRAGEQTLRRLAAVHLPDWELPPVAGGISVWARLPQPGSSALALAAHARGLLVPAGPRFGPDGSAFERKIRLPFTSSPKELEAAVPLLAEAWGQARGGGRPPRNPRRIPDTVV
ncbi:PLP-dependent aminotransferase family protein [Brevibacterium sp.]|uniref:aminotransferase-like domain-containing protein n=1 Tax=Brevibacterium sp. TaxID=1701 RepID=UPI0025C23854|nr:PLP-dependent aminotransferase family protein [Brevibacterium sp.]